MGLSFLAVFRGGRFWWDCLIYYDVFFWQWLGSKGVTDQVLFRIREECDRNNTMQKIQRLHDWAHEVEKSAAEALKSMNQVTLLQFGSKQSKDEDGKEEECVSSRTRANEAATKSQGPSKPGANWRKAPPRDVDQSTGKSKRFATSDDEDREVGEKESGSEDELTRKKKKAKRVAQAAIKNASRGKNADDDTSRGKKADDNKARQQSKHATNGAIDEAIKSMDYDALVGCGVEEAIGVFEGNQTIVFGASEGNATLSGGRGKKADEHNGGKINDEAIQNFAVTENLQAEFDAQSHDSFEDDEEDYGLENLLHKGM